ncbi:MAG: hypothetical protein WBA12_01160 [Catalinimonas sp.]
MRHLWTLFTQQFESLTKKRSSEWKVITLCILVAATIWMLNKLNKDYTTRLSYPIEIIYDPEAVVPVDRVPERVEIDVRGYGWNLLRRSTWLRRTPLRYEPENLPGMGYVTAGQLIPTLRAQMQDLELNFVLNDTLYLPFEARVEQRVAVRLDSQNIQLDPSYRVISPIRLEPDSITFVGATSAMSLLPPIFLLRLGDSNIDDDYDEEIPVEYPETDQLELRQRRVRVQFDVARFEERFIAVPVRSAFAPQGVALRDSVVVVNYTVNTEDAPALKPDSFTVVVDFRRLAQDSTLRPLLLRRPNGVYDVSFDPELFYLRDD